MDKYLHLFDNVIKKQKAIIFFYKNYCPYCMMFERTWKEFTDLLLLNNKDNVYIARINAGEIHRDIDDKWKKNKANKKDKTYTLTKGEYNRKSDSRFVGIFNVDSNIEEEFKRGIPTILFINGDDYYFYPSSIDKNLIDLCNIYAQIYDNMQFSHEELKTDITVSNIMNNINNINRRYIYIYSPFVLSNELNTKMDKKDLGDIFSLVSTANKKFSLLPHYVKNNFYVLNVNDEKDRYDFPFPAIYDIINEDIYIYKDCIDLLDKLIKE